LTAYTYILHNAPPSRVSTYAFVNPVVAVFLGWAVAGERITPRMLAAAAVIIASVILVITAPHNAAPEELGAQPVAPD
jgi:drug/metabolite transporter (DMT)-like permease